MPSIVVTGGNGFLGTAVCRRLAEDGVPYASIRSRDYDLTDQAAVERMYADHRPDIVIHLAAEVGGIGANQKRPGRFCYANLAMGIHLVEQARVHATGLFVHVGTACSYPKHCEVPFSEDSLWLGYPEETNAPYGIAKKAIGELLSSYAREYGMAGAYLIPANLYGPRDNFDPDTSHVIPAMIRSFTSGSDCVRLWGTGRATREFLYVDDAADAIVRATKTIRHPSPINIGAGEEVSISDLASLIASQCGYSGRIEWDNSKPDGQPRRAVDGTRAAELFGWRPSVALKEGIARTVEWWLRHGK